MAGQGRATTRAKRVTSSESGWSRWLQGVEILEVLADALEFRVDRERLGARRRPTVNVAFRLEPTSLVNTGPELALGFRFELRLNEQGRGRKAAEPMVHARMEYTARYSVPKAFATTDEIAKRFHTGIAIAHVFPFVRAHLADLAMRAGLPPLYLPLSRTAAATTR